MKKKWGKKLVVAMLATVCVVTAVGCGKKETKADYQNTYDPSEFASASYHAGYMGSLCPEDSDASYTASVSFKDDQYVLTKEIVGPTTQVVGHNVDIDVKYVFSGSYTQDGDKYTLKAPEKCEWSEDY